MPPGRLYLIRSGPFTFLRLPEMEADLAAADAADPGVRGDVAAVLARMREGRHRSGDSRYPLRSEPEIGEIRIGRHRLYFAEPPGDHVVLGLAFTKKRDHGDVGSTGAQDADIARAADRYRVWRTRRPPLNPA